MKLRHLTFLSLTTGVAIVANAFVVDWDKIEFWAGEGTARSALVVQFADDGPDCAYVWGYRWNPEDFEDGAPSGEDMFRAVASASPDLLLFTQYTGSLGSTVDGIGYFNPRGKHPAKSIAYNFEGARNDARVSFDYFAPNTLMGQTKAPGNFTPVYCQRAIDAAIESNIIEHPVNAREYGYPAYDYDWWQPSEPLDPAGVRWNAGWYDGYWSYWVGGVDSRQLSYSGLGYSSRKLADGQVDGWKFMPLNGPVTGWDPDGSTGASEPWAELNYAHFNDPQAAATSIDADGNRLIGAVFTLGGTRVDHTRRLTPGIYVVKYSDGSTVKLNVK